jgi:hypothetical protein
MTLIKKDGSYRPFLMIKPFAHKLHGGAVVWQRYRLLRHQTSCLDQLSVQFDVARYQGA